ncbi:MAG: hypothetical protein SFW09_24060 [Hyphomicrobiaceae bacterium]|nr:hypothetical protein [Hyphomicrobiaceae bacterium]
MATIVTVHGTFAHDGSGSSAQPGTNPADLQWWETGSTFDSDMRELVDAAPGAGSGKLDVKPFVWRGDNSEIGRRKAGLALLNELKGLEEKGEPYCVVGHSHGGSVVSWALLEGAARKQPLQGLKRWITVGTPFVTLRKETLLFQRLDLIKKVIFVASMMLLAMFFVYLAAEAFTGSERIFGGTFPAVLVFTGVMMSLPMLVFYLALKSWDALSLIHYRRRVKQRAHTEFSSRWLALTHTDDEAVQGLAFLPGAKLYFFDKTFAVSTLTMLSVVALPVIYLLLLASPQLMVGIGDWLKANVYDSKHIQAETALRDMRTRFRDMRAQQPTAGATPEQRTAMWAKYREMRRELATKFPDLPAAERSLRFKQRFFEENGRPCAGGKLCGGGRDIKINSGLLLHVVTDELSSAIAGEGAATFLQRSIWTVLIPAVLVPVIFGLFALLLMLVIRALAHLVSKGASHLLNNITNAEVKRAAFGNDTEGEIAVGALDRPSWIERSQPRLPASLGDLVTSYANGIANNSLAKFRKAIGQLASADPKHTADTAITTYFTWKELVHASYFDVPEVRKLIAVAVSRCDGFAPSARLEADPDHARAAEWLAEIEGGSGSRLPPAAHPPTASDKEAVSAVVASTVTSEP